jgi:hypothetical protein
VELGTEELDAVCRLAWVHPQQALPMITKEFLWEGSSMQQFGPPNMVTIEAGQCRARLRFLLDFLGRVLAVEYPAGSGGQSTLRTPDALARCSHAVQSSPQGDVVTKACDAAFNYLVLPL